jgi:2,3-dihydroxybiphenyl 1,2-dioxygenase
MASVSELGYLGVGVSDAMAWQEIATSIFGMQAVAGEHKSTCYLRLDAFHHRLELHANGRDDLEFAGWEVPDARTLDSVAAQLEDGGVKVTVGGCDEADRRRVIGLIKCVDPAGISTEIFFGRPVNPSPFHPTRPTSGFKTEGEGLGHILVQVPDLDASVRFYRDLLGFRISDFTDVRTPDGMLRLAFLHCNTRHHSIAFIEAPGAPKRLNHIMFEGNSLADVGTGRDLCLARGVPIAVDLGCHMNDRMVSFYMGSPSGFALEYGWGARTIDDATWQVEHYSSVDSIWGHPQLRSLASGGH